MKIKWPVLGACLLTSVNAVAQTNIKDLGLSEVTGDADSKADAVVDADDLAKLSPTTLNGIFKLTPSVTVNGGRAQSQQIFVNGLESNLSNVTVDGAQQGNLFHHSGNVFLEPELLKQVEVDSGAGNALQGLGALNGALKFETKSAHDFLKDGQKYGGLSSATYYGNGAGYKLSQTFAMQLTDDWAMMLSGGYNERDAYEDGDGNKVELTDYTGKNLLFKLSGEFGNGHSLDFSHEYTNSNTFSYDRLNILGDYMTSIGRDPGILQRVDLTRQTTTLKHRYTDASNDLIDIKSTLSYNTQEYSRETSGDTVELGTLGFSIMNKSRWTDTVSSSYGFDFKKTKADIDRPTSFVGSEDETAYGFFLQTDWDFHEMATLSVGGRYDRYDFEDQVGSNFESGRFSPNASITVRPVEGLELEAGYAEAYRGVGIREAYIPSARPADLDGEVSKTAKISATYRKQGYFVYGSYFDQGIDNYIDPSGGDTVYGNIRNKGYEFRVGYQNDKFATSITVTDNSPELEGVGESEALGMVVGGRRWVADANYKLLDDTLTVGGNVEYRESVDGSASVDAKESYALFNAYFALDVQQVEGLSVTLNIDNIFDRQYTEHTSYTGVSQASPGRQFSLGAKYEF